MCRQVGHADLALETVAEPRLDVLAALRWHLDEVLVLAGVEHVIVGDLVEQALAEIPRSRRPSETVGEAAAEADGGNGCEGHGKGDGEVSLDPAHRGSAEANRLRDPA